MKGLRAKYLSPSRLIALTFVGLILTGTVLLMLPMASRTGQSLSFVDALFTATSASCVTGLVVVDTGTYFSLFGQVVLLLLIQLGGLGLMLFATLFSVLLKRRLDLQGRLALQVSLNRDELSGVVRMSLKIVRYTAVIEGVLGTLLALYFLPRYGPKGIYYGYWHSVSAFCNAGFDLFGNFQSLTLFVGDPVVNLLISLLIILGGLGFAVMSDLLQVKTAFARLQTHSKLVLATTGLLLVVGTVGFFVLEKDNPATIGNLSAGTSFMASFFQSVSPRTAGFNTVDLGSLQPATMLFLGLLMLIGASPASTGGGIKTTTFALILLHIAQIVRGEEDCTLFGRRVGRETMDQAFAIAGLSLLWIVAAVFLLTLLEQASLQNIVFEVVSAYATVGLSTGLSQHAGTLSKLILILSMYMGRVGVMTFALALTARKRKEHIRYPEGHIMVG